MGHIDPKLHAVGKPKQSSVGSCDQYCNRNKKPPSIIFKATYYRQPSVLKAGNEILESSMFWKSLVTVKGLLSPQLGGGLFNFGYSRGGPERVKEMSAY